MAARLSNLPALAQLLTTDVAEAMAKLSREEALARFGAEDVPCGVVRELDELHTDPRVVTNLTFVERNHPLCGALREPRPPVRFGPDPLEPAAPAPAGSWPETERLAVELPVREPSEALECPRACAGSSSRCCFFSPRVPPAVSVRPLSSRPRFWSRRSARAARP